MKLAWNLFRQTTNYSTFGQALKASWLAIKAKAMLKWKPTLLTFRKADGTVTQRPATAWVGEVTGSGKSNSLTILFQDHSKGGKTSSFRADRLIGFGLA